MVSQEDGILQRRDRNGIGQLCVNKLLIGEVIYVDDDQDTVKK